MMRSLVLFLTVLAGPWPAHAGPVDKTPLRIEDCVDAPISLLDSLDASWQRVRRFVQLCPVRRPRGGDVALSVLIVRLDRVLDAGILDWGYQEPRIPFPVILDRRNRRIGTLPEGLPIDPPSELKVAFTDWRDGWPDRIELYEAGTSALQPHPLPPMIWDRHSRRYIEVMR